MMEEEREQENNYMSREDGECSGNRCDYGRCGYGHMCLMCGGMRRRCGRGHYFALRLLLGIIILVAVFAGAFKLGELRAIMYGSGIYGYGYDHPMMWYGADSQGYGYGPGMMRQWQQGGGYKNASQIQ